MDARALEEETAAACFIPSSLQEVLHAIAHATIRQRKVMLDTIRVNQDPAANAKFRSIIHSDYSTVITCICPDLEVPFGWTNKQVSLPRICTIISSYNDRPIITSFLSMAVRSLSSIGQDLEKEVHDAIFKELSAATGPMTFPRFDYSSVLGHTYNERMTVMHPEFPNRPYFQTMVFERLHKLKDQLPHLLFFPRYQRIKTMSYSTGRGVCGMLGIHTTYEAAMYMATMKMTTSLHLQQLYHEHGYKMDQGIAEVRYAWKFNDLAPRVYYAQGGSEYWQSQYIQEFSNLLVKCMRTTHPDVRFNLYRLNPIHAHEFCFLYDLTSFTSMLGELRYFMRALATFFKGTRMRVVDAHNGVGYIDAGEMLDAYTSASLDGPMFSLERIQGNSWECQDQHRCAGMLGTYGNIVLSTFLHGYALTLLVGGEDLATCVGDDGFGVGNKQEWSGPKHITAPLWTLGILHPRKVYFWLKPTPEGHVDRYKFLKRSVEVVEDAGIIVGLLLEFPVLAMILGKKVAGRTVTMGSPFQRLLTALTQFNRLIKRLHLYDATYQDEDIHFLQQFAIYFYSRFTLPFNGSVPPHKSLLPRIPIYPIHNIREVIRDPVGALCRELIPGQYIALPSLISRNEARLGTPVRDLGDMRYGIMSKMEKLMVDLGYISRERVPDEMHPWSHDTEVLYREFLMGDQVAKYRIEMVKDPPAWYLEFVESQNEYPQVPYNDDSDSDQE